MFSAQAENTALGRGEDWDGETSASCTSGGAQCEGPHTTKSLGMNSLGMKMGIPTGNLYLTKISHPGLVTPPALEGRCEERGAEMIPSEGERIYPLREMSLFRTRNVKTFCKRVVPANFLFGGGGKVQFGVAGMTPTIGLPLNFIIKQRFFRSFSFPENPPEHPESKENCCAANGEASPKRIHFFSIYFWELKIFDGIFFPLNNNNKKKICIVC